jgi:putative peptidoglycan lipid II flippase
MVKKTLAKLMSAVSGEIAGIHRAAYLIGAFTLLSQVLALFRDRLLASSFGAGHTLDLYYAAFRVPDLVFATLASLVSVSVLIPFFTTTAESGGEHGAVHSRERVQKLMSEIFSFFVIMMTVASVILFILMPLIAEHLFPGFDTADFATIILMSRILLLQPIFLGISNLLSAITQIHKRFFVYALAPIFYNFAIIFGILFLYPLFGIEGVVIGVVIGSILHFSIQIPYVSSVGALPVPTLKWDSKRLIEILKLSIPRTITLSANQLELIFITSYASLLTAGSISIFSLATNLQSVPFAIIGVSYTLAAFPTLSHCYVNGKKEEFLEHVRVAARHIIFWSFPIISLFIVLRAQIVRVVLGSGSFDWNDTRLVAASVALFIISLAAQGLELLFIRSYYAAGKTKKPLFVNIFSSIMTITLPYVFLQIFYQNEMFSAFIERLFRVSEIPGTEVLMLPLGYMCGTLINALIFWIMFEMDFGSFTKKVMKTSLQSFEAAVIAGFVAYLTLNLFDSGFDSTKTLGVFFHGLISGLVGIVAWAAVLLVLKNNELVEIYASFRRKISKNVEAHQEVVVSEADVVSH